MQISKIKLKRIIAEEVKLLGVNSLVLEVKAEKSLNNPTEVLQAFAKKLIKRGYNVSNAKELGSGYNGTAYSFGDGKRVLKITMDTSEASTANHLRGKKLNHIIHIYDVFKFGSAGSQEWFGIIEDLAEKFSEHEKSLFNAYRDLILANLSLSVSQQIESSPWYMDWKEIKRRVLTNTKPDPEEYKQAQEGIKFFEFLGFDKILGELKKNKVEYFDVHADNFMKKNGTLVLVDLGGNSQSPGTAPNMLEKTAH